MQLIRKGLLKIVKALNLVEVHFLMVVQQSRPRSSSQGPRGNGILEVPCPIRHHIPLLRRVLKHNPHQDAPRSQQGLDITSMSKTVREELPLRSSPHSSRSSPTSTHSSPGSISTHGPIPWKTTPPLPPSHPVTSNHIPSPSATEIPKSLSASSTAQSSSSLKQP